MELACTWSKKFKRKIICRFLLGECMYVLMIGMMLLLQKEREAYEVIVEDGKLVYKESGDLVDTVGDCKWIFVLSTSRCLYVGQKKKGLFQHSSFLAGAATTAAGRLISDKGVLQVQYFFFFFFFTKILKLEFYHEIISIKLI